MSDFDTMVLSEPLINLLFPNYSFIRKMNKLYSERYINSQPLLKFEYEMIEYKAKKAFLNDELDFNDKFETWGIDH